MPRSIREYRQVHSAESAGLRCSHQQVANLLRAFAKLRLHPHHQVEELFSLHNLRGRLPAHCRLYNRSTSATLMP